MLYKKLLLLLLIIFQSLTIYAADNDIEKEYNYAMDLYDQKNFNESFKILNNICTNNKFQWACFHLANHYFNGYGTNKNYNKALELYEEVAQNSNDRLYLGSKMQVATIKEYFLADINGAMKIYEELINCPESFISDACKKGLDRNKGYNFINKFINLFVDFSKNRISSDELDFEISKLDTYSLPNDARETFFKFRQSLLKSARIFEKRQKNKIPLIANSISKLLTEDYSIFSDTYDTVSERSELKNELNNMVTLGRKFFQQLASNPDSQYSYEFLVLETKKLRDL